MEKPVVEQAVSSAPVSSYKWLVRLGAAFLALVLVVSLALSMAIQVKIAAVETAAGTVDADAAALNYLVGSTQYVRADALSRVRTNLKSTFGAADALVKYYALASVAIAREEYGEALSYIEACLKSDGVTDEVYQDLRLKQGCLLALLGDAMNARVIFNDLCATHPNNAEARLLLAEMSAELGNAAGAAQSLAAYVALNPEDTASYLSLSQLYFVAGEYEKARAAADSYLAVEDTYAPTAYYLRGQSEMQLAALPQARADFEAARTAGYPAADCYEQMALCAYLSGDYPGAVSLGKQAQDAAAEGRDMTLLHTYMGYASLQLGDYEAGVTYLTDALAGADSVEARYYRGVCYMALERYIEAEQDFTSLLVAGEDTLFLYNRGACRLARGDGAGAAEDFRRVAQRGDDAELAATALALLSEIEKAQ